MKADVNTTHGAKRLALITTTFQSERYVAAYCRGVTALTNLEDIEVRLVMNDPGEVERTIVAEYSHRYPGVFHVAEVPRESIGASMNRALLEARTPYVAFLDVDDVRVPDSLARQMEVLDSNPDTDFTYGDFITVSSQGLTEGELVTTPEFEPNEFARSCLASPSQMFRRSLVERIGGFDEQLRSGGDYEFQIRAALNCRFVKTHGVMVYYTRYPESRSASSSNLQPLERTAVELRYGLYDKTMSLNGYPFIEEARSSYRLGEVLLARTWHPIEEFVPDYAAMLTSRAKGLEQLARSYARWKRRQSLRVYAHFFVPVRVRRYGHAALRRARLGRPW